MKSSTLSSAAEQSAAGGVTTAASGPSRRSRCQLRFGGLGVDDEGALFEVRGEVAG